MRNGTLLAEDSPANIITRFQVESLEEAFLQLSLKQEKKLLAVTSESKLEVIETNVEVVTNILPDLAASNSEQNYTIKMKALLNKNMMQLLRQRL